MTQPNPYIGKQIGNYRIEREIDRGAYGRVYLAQHLYLTERLAVVKLLHLLYLGSREEQASFLQEAQFLERLKHPHILTILDVGIDDDRPYIIAEYAQKGSLRHLLKRQAGQLVSPVEAISILTQVGQGLQHAHEQNVIHRDLKPENILFNAKGDALLADFGISTVLSTSSVKHTDVVGTPAYMAPEQFRGIISRESDQYALGCIAYELFTGQRPFAAPDFVAMGFKHTTEYPIRPGQLNPSIMPYIEDIIFKAMAKERTDRYPDIATFVAALQNIAPQEKVQERRVYGQQNHQSSTGKSSAVDARAYNDHHTASPEKDFKPGENITAQRNVSSPRFLSDSQVSDVTFRNSEVAYMPQAIGADSIESFYSIPGGLRVFAGLNYLLLPVTWLIFLIIGVGRKNRFVRFHMMQSFLLWLLMLITAITFADLPPVKTTSGILAIIEYGLFFFLLLSLPAFLIAMISAFIGRYGKVPLFGAEAEKFANIRSGSNR